MRGGKHRKNCDSFELAPEVKLVERGRRQKTSRKTRFFTLAEKIDQDLLTLELLYPGQADNRVAWSSPCTLSVPRINNQAQSKNSQHKSYTTGFYGIPPEMTLESNVQ